MSDMIERIATAISEADHDWTGDYRTLARAALIETRAFLDEYGGEDALRILDWELKDAT